MQKKRHTSWRARIIMTTLAMAWRSSQSISEKLRQSTELMKSIQVELYYHSSWYILTYKILWYVQLDHTFQTAHKFACLQTYDSLWVQLDIVPQLYLYMLHDKVNV
jgi:hypothetical protein